jgi:hypothetical protein
MLLAFRSLPHQKQGPISAFSYLIGAFNVLLCRSGHDDGALCQHQLNQLPCPGVICAFLGLLCTCWMANVSTQWACSLAKCVQLSTIIINPS